MSGDVNKFIENKMIDVLTNKENYLKTVYQVDECDVILGFTYVICENMYSNKQWLYQ